MGDVDESSQHKTYFGEEVEVSQGKRQIHTLSEVN